MSSRPLRVVMPVLTLVPGAMGGSETYARALVAGLDSRDDVELTVIASRAAAGALGASSEHVVRSVRGGPATVSRLSAIARGALADGTARALMRDADVVHYPFTVPVPLPPRRVPWVATLLDVQHRDLPAMFSVAERGYRALAYDAAARRARRVITISDFCRQRINDQLGVPLERIDVAHLGVDLDRFTFYDGPREPFVLYPATAWPHKNHARLFEAMRQVRKQRPDLRLVLTGGRREALGALPPWVEHQGVVSDDVLVDLYRRAACLAFPSLYEGFGLPPLEAMASGCPVAVADAGSLREICDPAAVLLDATDPRAIGHGIERALDDAPELIARGHGRAQTFAWEGCVAAHLHSYLAGSTTASRA